MQDFQELIYSQIVKESIHTWTKGTLEGWSSFHDIGPQGPCPGIGLEVKIYNTYSFINKSFMNSYQGSHLSVSFHTWAVCTLED